MKKSPYYGLRVMSVVYKALAVVIALFAIGAVGYIWAEALNNSDVAANAWEIRAIMTLGIGGLVALTCYVLSQLIDAQLETLENTQELKETLSTFKNMEATQAEIHRLLKMKTRQTSVTEPLPPLKEEDLAKIQGQLEERSQKLRSK